MRNTREITTWENEGGFVHTPIRLRPHWRRRWRRWFAARGAQLERGWAKLWIYNPTVWSLLRTFGVFIAVLLSPVFFALAVVPLLVMMPLVALVAVPMALLTFVLR